MVYIRNIKISLKVQPFSLDNAIEILKNRSQTYAFYHNFITFSDFYNYVVFKTGSDHQNHINITKIKNLDSVSSAINKITDIFKLIVNGYSIDNIIATTDINRKLDLKKIIKNKLFPRAKYNSERFPGLFLKFNLGTLILFHSGKIVLVGCKSEESIKCLMKDLLATIQEQL